MSETRYKIREGSPFSSENFRSPGTDMLMTVMLTLIAVFAVVPTLLLLILGASHSLAKIALTTVLLVVLDAGIIAFAVAHVRKAYDSDTWTDGSGDAKRDNAKRTAAQSSSPALPREIERQQQKFAEASRFTRG